VDSKEIVAFIEPLAGGHHGTYLKWLWKCIEALNRKSILVTTRDALQSDDFAQNLKHTTLLDNPVVLNMPKEQGYDFAGKVISRLRWGAWIRKACLATPNSAQLLLPYADLFFYQLAFAPWLIAGRRWSGIVMSPTFHHPACLGYRKVTARDRFQEYLFGRALAQPNLASLFCIDPLLQDYCYQRFDDNAQKLSYFPDPAEGGKSFNQLRVRNQMGIKDSAFVVLCYGSISMRKGLKEIAECLNSPELAKNVLFVIAGRLDKGAKEFVASDQFQRHIVAGRIILRAEYCSLNEEADLFFIADLVWTVYPEFYQMSGVMARSFVYSRPFLALDSGLIGWYAKEFQAGLVSKSLAGNDIVASINLLVHHPAALRHLKKNAEKNMNLFSLDHASKIIASAL
jgi:hypothetical protein